MRNATKQIVFTDNNFESLGGVTARLNSSTMPGAGLNLSEERKVKLKMKKNKVTITPFVELRPAVLSAVTEGLKVAMEFANRVLPDLMPHGETTFEYATFESLSAVNTIMLSIMEHGWGSMQQVLTGDAGHVIGLFFIF